MVPTDWEVVKPPTRMNAQMMVPALITRSSDNKHRIFEECVLFTDIMKSRKVTPIVSGLSKRRSLDW